MKRIACLIACLLTLPAYGAMYKWVDAQGRVQYTDTPPPPNAKKVEEHRIVPNTIQTGSAPFAVQDAAKRNPVTVWMNECGDLCNRARDYLAKRGVPHAVRNPARQDEQEAWKKISGGDNSVPLLIVGSLQTLKGFDEAQWDTALSKAGYPRSAPSMKPQAIPSGDPGPAKPPASGTPAASAAPTSPAK